MKKNTYINNIINNLFIFIILFFTYWTNNTNSFSINLVTPDEYEINRWEIFNFYAWFFDWLIPESYKYIHLNFKDIELDSQLYKSLQKLVYLDLIKNSEIKIYENKSLNAYDFYRFSEIIFKINIINKKEKNEKDELKKIETNINHLNKAESIINYKKLELKNKYSNSKNKIELKKAIFWDIYSIILNEHYDKNSLNEDEIINSAIEWLANWTKDRHTVYFPPTETKNFYESLNWEYEWIWSYVDMETPWVFKIITPIKDSPSQKAWLKWWDRVLKVDWVEIKKENSAKEVISWIKWPKWTNVILTIQRNNKIFDVTVTRDKIIINDVEFDTFWNNTFYIEIKSFWENVSNDFENAINELSQKKWIKKVIIDLRNNWGWYLSQVTNMLSYFVKKDEITAHVKYIDNTMNYYSKWYDTVDFSKYKIVILQNSWTASASEILIWTILDYYTNTIVIWEKSYWKWSVQTIKRFWDWSTFKYTVAKWFTWKTQTWIDWVWIIPTIELEFNLDLYNKYQKDNQLEKAKDI